VSLSTIHGNFQPSFSPSTCFPPACEVVITNNCPNHITFFNYFDRLVLQLGDYPPLTYYVKCNDEFLGNTFEWGLVIEIVAVCVLVTVAALYSKAWSLGGRGIEFNIWLVATFSLVLVLGALIGYFSYEGITVCLSVLSCVLGVIGVAVCTNEVLFLFRLKWLLRPLASWWGF
jgi:hypothetical protein